VKRVLASVVLALALLAAGPAVQAQRVTVKLATLAPDGSHWHESLKDLAARWQEVSGGRVKLRIYAGGVAGDELDVMRKIRIGQLHAAFITTHGLNSITHASRVFNLPRMIRSNPELDFVMGALTPKLDALLEDGGFIALGWGDAGWARFFVPKPVTSIGEVRRLKMFTWAGDPETTELWIGAGFNPVPLPTTEMTTALQTGLVEAIPVPPSVVMAAQWYSHTPYMIDLDIAPLTGALIVSERIWSRIPEELRPLLREEAKKIVIQMRQDNRRLELDAVKAMEKRGLEVLVPLADETREWNSIADEVNRKMRGGYVPGEYFDEVLRLVKEFRAGGSGTQGQ
jgi:TRAP-type C4-dicarboxylate transport system substrate-binding protein